MNQQIKTFSLRAQNFLSDAQKKSKTLKNHYEVKLDKGDKILTLSCPIPTNNATENNSEIEIELITNEAFIKLLQGRGLNQIAEMSFRELENFLRDENHIPAFGEVVGHQSVAESVFNRQKWKLFSAVLKEFSYYRYPDLVSKIDLPTQNLADKNAGFIALFELITRSFHRGEKLKFVFFDSGTLYVKCADSSWSESELEFFLQAIVSEFLQGAHIKVVAVQ